MYSEVLERLNRNFSYEVTINPSDSVFYDFITDSETDDYQPFRNISVFNTGSSDIKIFINNASGSDYKLIPAGTILELDNKRISSVKFVNKSSVSNANFTFTVNNDVKVINLLNHIIQRFKL